MHRKAILILTILFSSILFFSCKSSTEPGDEPIAQDFTFSIENFRTYDITNSPLPENYIGTIAVDNQNNIWAGTYYKGIAKFDGSRWTIYNTKNSGLPCDSIWSIKVDYHNNIWIGTFNGLAKFDGNNWTVYNMSNSSLPYTDVFSIAVDKMNTLWIGCGHATGGGLLSFDGSKWNLYTPANSQLPSSIINTIHVDQNNNKWVGTGIFQGRGGLVKIDNMNNWRVYTMSNSKILYNLVNGIDTDEEGNIWISQNAWHLLSPGYYHGGLQKIKGESWTDLRPNPEGKYNSSAVVSNRVDAIKCDKNGYTWVATEPEWEFNANLSLCKNGVWRTVSDVKKDFIRPYIREMVIDKNGTLWMATNPGVVAFDYKVHVNNGE